MHGCGASILTLKGLMNTLYLLVADPQRAKLYKTRWPPALLELIFHQTNFIGGSAQRAGFGANDEDFARTLGRMLKADHQAGRFNQLVVVTTNEFLAVIRRHLDGECSNLVKSIVVQAPAQLLEPDLLRLLHNLLAQQADVAPAPVSTHSS